MQRKLTRYTFIAILMFMLTNGSAFSQERGGGGGGGQAAGGRGPARPQLTITASAWTDGGPIPPKYAGQMGISPAVEWVNAPEGTVSFILLFRDPDGAPQKSSWGVTHWLLWNIPATTHQLPEGVQPGPQLADGTQQGKNVAGMNAYRGPGSMVHHYTFELFALDQKINVAPDATLADVLKAADGHVLSKASYVSQIRQQ